jgi:hypothetical protein
MISITQGFTTYKQILTVIYDAVRLDYFTVKLTISTCRPIKLSSSVHTLSQAYLSARWCVQNVTPIHN